MKILLSVLFVLLSLTSLKAQKIQGSIEGTILDSAAQALDKASIRLIHAKDSTIAYAELTSEKGTFKITGIEEGEYIMLITYLGYESITKSLVFSKEKHDFNFGNITMKSGAVSLSGITIEQAAPPLQIKGDTLEFNAGSFKTRPNAVVEDLLKKIPGIEVTSDGTIKSEGEEIQQILVDGKPFFGDDPKIATKNLPSEIIDKVQIYDKNSDQAEFTGVDDGNKKKTINLKIKKDKKVGTFGKADAGIGTENRFSTGANLFRFNGDRQISFVGSGNNVNRRNYSFRDVRQGGGGSSGNGDLTNWMSGVNYRDNWGKKISVTGNYFYNYNDRNSIREQETQYILPDTTYYKSQDQNSWSKTINHRFNMRIDYQIDSMNSLLFTPSVSYSSNSYNSSNVYHSNDFKNAPINAGSSSYSSSTESPNFSGSLLYRKRFDKKGRTFSVNLNGGLNNNDASGYNKQNTTTYDGALATMDSVNQHFIQNNDGKNWGIRLAYTEPLSETRTLEVHAAHNNNVTTSEKDTYNQDGNGKYNEFDSTYSNNFRNTYRTEQAGFNIQTRKEDYDYTIGFNVKNNLLNNYSISGDSSFSQSTINYFPEARFNYNFSRTKRLRINYNGSTSQPSINQLQPVPDNSESLRKVIGNPDLKPSFTHSLNLNFRNFNRENYHMLFVRFGISTTMNDIVNSTEYLNGGKQLVHYENTNGNFNLNGSVTAGIPIKENTNMVNTNTSVRYGKSSGFINDEKNISNNLNLSERLSFNYSYKELLDFRLSGNVSYNKVSYTLQKSQNTDYFNYGGSFDFNINLPAHFMLQTDIRYSANTGLSQGYNQKVAMWNASVSKYILKDQKGMIKLEAFDLLNQQVDITRNITSQYIQDVRTNVLPQYFLLSFTYFLKKFPGAGDHGPGRGRGRGMRMDGPRMRGF